MSSVAYAPHVAQSPNFHPPPDPFDLIAAQYSKVIDQNHDTLEEQGFTPKFMWALAALMGYYLMSKERVIFGELEKMAKSAKVSARTMKRALAFMRSIQLLNMTPKGIPGQRGGRDDSEYRFNESHSLWKILYVPVKKPVSRETPKCQVGTLNRQHPNIYRGTPTTVTVPINRYTPSTDGNLEPAKTKANEQHPVFDEDVEILQTVMLDYAGIALAAAAARSILAELPPEYGGAPGFLQALPAWIPRWHNWHRIASPRKFLRSIAEQQRLLWDARRKPTQKVAE